MSIPQTRPFASSNYPASPSLTTAPSLNYSQYGNSSFNSPNARGPTASVASSSYSAGTGRSMAQQRPGGGAGGGLRPPGGGDGRKMESKEVARVHWTALREFLTSGLEKESPSSRASAREKLTRLTKLQFQELSTDVYDELMRRISVENGAPDGNMPFLPVRDDFHPKRNQARQKLATLPRNRFKDLASDVFHELRRRYPEFDEEEAEERLRAEDPPPAPGPQPIRPSYNPHPSQSSLRSAPTPPPISRLNSSNSSSQHQRQGSRAISASSSTGSQNQGMHRSRPSRELNIGSGPDRTAATNEVVVPNKSRMREEEIEVPYARDSIVEVSSGRVSRAESTASRISNLTDRERARTPRDREVNGNGGTEMLSPATNDEREYYDRMSFSSNVTNKSRALAQGAGGWDEEREKKIRAEYEFRIAGLERRAAVAEGEREDARRKEGEERERRKEWEDEVRGLKERATTHASSLRSLQHELDVSRDSLDTSRRHADGSGRQAEEEVAQWRDRCDGLEDELRRMEEEKEEVEQAAARANGGGGGNSDQTTREMKQELQSLVEELTTLSMRNDELVAARERDAQTINEMEARVEEYRRKYDTVRIELRNLKATSTMFTSKPANDDHLPASADGNIADINVSSFQTAIDTLLSAARSSTPSGVLPAMKAIVEAITEIGADVKQFESHPNLPVDVSRLESLKHESTTRLNNLMQAARNHAMAQGLSPVSLIDAAAGHLSANVVEIIKLLKIRRSGKGEGGGGGGARRGSLSIGEMVRRSSGGVNENRDLKKVNGNWDKEYGASPVLPTGNGNGGEERLREPGVMVRQPSEDEYTRPNLSARSGSGQGVQPLRVGTLEGRLNGLISGPNTGNGSGGGHGSAAFRINSFQSASSAGARSDSFDLERKASVASQRDGAGGGRAIVTAGGGGFGMGRRDVGRGSVVSDTSGSSAVLPVTAYDADDGDRGNGFGYSDRSMSGEGGDNENEADMEREWEDLKPYLNTQSSALVNSIQNLLAAIRTGGTSPALNEHLSEVIAIASSIVAVAGNSLPPALRREGDGLIKDLVINTDKLSEAQQVGSGGGGVGGGFEKGTRQVIASASFGVAKSLKSLMKLGTD